MTYQKRIVIGGITGGIGSALAKELLSQGHLVTGFARDLERIESLKSELGINVIQSEATDCSKLTDSINELHAELGKIDAYVHAIGSIYLKPAHLTSEEDWNQTLLANLSSAFFALRASSKLMSKQGSGSMLFFSTAAASVGIANHEAIAAAKGGIEAMLRSAAASYANRGIRINAVAPSLTNTPLSEGIIGNDQALEISKRMHPLGSIGNAEDIASLAAWLISDKAKFVTGQTFVVDGGISSIVPKIKA